MRFSAFLCFAGICVPTLICQTVDVGTGAPSDYIRSEFVDAFARGAFSRIAALPPAGGVRRFGPTGLVQEFNDSRRSGSKLALISPSSVASPGSANDGVLYVLTDIYTYYSSVGVTTAGYPTMDTAICPASACTWQLF